MLIVDRVVCDLCLAPMGQLYSQSADTSGWASDFGMAPDYAVCPDCQASAQQQADGTPTHSNERCRDGIARKLPR